MELILINSVSSEQHSKFWPILLHPTGLTSAFGSLLQLTLTSRNLLNIKGVHTHASIIISQIMGGSCVFCDMHLLGERPHKGVDIFGIIHSLEVINVKYYFIRCVCLFYVLYYSPLKGVKLGFYKCFIYSFV